MLFLGKRRREKDLGPRSGPPTAGPERLDVTRVVAAEAALDCTQRVDCTPVAPERTGSDSGTDLIRARIAEKPLDLVPTRMTERRRAVRYPCDVEVYCCPSGAAGDLKWKARVRNISLGGLALLLSRRFEPGTVLLVEADDGPSRFPSLLMARVVHARRLPQGAWVLGCTFAAPVSDSLIKSLL